MSKQPFPSLDAEIYFSKYPKSIKRFAAWIKTFSKQEVVGDNDAVYQQSLKAVLYFAPRTLYEFFDGEGINLFIGRADGGRFSYTATGSLHSSSSETRRDAEERGFELAFEALEEKLS